MLAPVYGDSETWGRGMATPPRTERSSSRPSVWSRTTARRPGGRSPAWAHLKCGWDTAERGETEAHIEVTGVSSSLPSLLLTRNELRTAVQDDVWSLAIVTTALTNPPCTSSHGSPSSPRLTPRLPGDPGFVIATPGPGSVGPPSVLLPPRRRGSTPGVGVAERVRRQSGVLIYGDPMTDPDAPVPDRERTLG